MMPTNKNRTPKNGPDEEEWNDFIWCHYYNLFMYGLIVEDPFEKEQLYQRYTFIRDTALYRLLVDDASATAQLYQRYSFIRDTALVYPGSMSEQVKGLTQTYH